MNERIEKLAEQAVIAVDDPFPGNPLNDELEKMYIPDCFSEKFAELIVKECCEQILKKTEDEELMDSWDRGYIMGLRTAFDTIREHFGVEE